VKARPWVIVCVGLAGLCLGAPAGAQGLRLALPTSIAASAAAADWASTYYALTRKQVHEVNPVLRPLEGRPTRLVLLGAAIDVAGVWAWNRSVGTSRPTIAASGLWVMAAFRGYLALHNINNARRAPRRSAAGADPADTGAAPAGDPATLTPAPADPSITTRSGQ